MFSYEPDAVDLNHNKVNKECVLLKLYILSGIETIGHKQLGAPFLPSQFPMHQTPHYIKIFNNGILRQVKGGGRLFVCFVQQPLVLISFHIIFSSVF